MSAPGRSLSWFPSQCCAGRPAAEHQPSVPSRQDQSGSFSMRLKEAFEKLGREGLPPQPRRRPRMPKETRPEIEG